MKPIKIKIKDMPWSVSMLSDFDYEVLHEKDSDGITIGEHGAIHLKKSKLSVELLRHELLHAYVGSCCIESMTDLTKEDLEEIIAEIVAYHGEDLCKLARKLYNSLKAQHDNE